MNPHTVVPPRKALPEGVTIRHDADRGASMSESQKKVLDLRSVFGLEATVTTLSAATDGAYVEMEIVLEPNGHTNAHYHPEQEETFEVLGGALEIFRDGEWHKLSAGQSLTVPRGVTHALRNTTETPARFLNVHRPALTFQGFLQTVDRLIRAGKIKGSGDSARAYTCRWPLWSRAQRYR